MLLELVAEPAGGAHEGPLEWRVGERLDLAAVVADQMMVVVSARVRRLEACDAVAQVDSLHEVELDESVERAVDARDTDLAAAVADPVVDLLRRAAARVQRELVDNRPPCTAASKPGVAELGERGLGPGRHFA